MTIKLEDIISEIKSYGYKIRYLKDIGAEANVSAITYSDSTIEVSKVILSDTKIYTRVMAHELAHIKLDHDLLTEKPRVIFRHELEAMCFEELALGSLDKPYLKILKNDAKNAGISDDMFKKMLSNAKRKISKIKIRKG